MKLDGSKIMKIFFDTEFTGLHKNTTLISIGLIDENNRTFYAEFSDYDESQCDEWIHENVIKHLKWSKEGSIENFGNYDDMNHIEMYGDKNYIKMQLEQWLSQYDEVELVSDCCHYDMVLFIDIFGGAFDIPKQVNPACHDINQDIATYYKISEREAFEVSREDILSSNNFIVDEEIMKHNALFDAQVIKEIYNIVKY